MDNKTNSQQQKQQKDSPEVSKRKKCIQQIIYLCLFVFGVLMLAIVAMQMCVKGTFCKGNTGIENKAVESLKLKKGNPEGFKVIAISELDSVFVNRYCPEHETIELSQKYLDLTFKMMDEDFNLEDNNHVLNLKRYSEASDAISLFNEMLERPQGEHIGWRLKMRYSYLDESKNECNSEVWMIFDKDKKFIYNTFEFPLL